MVCDSLELALNGNGGLFTSLFTIRDLQSLHGPLGITSCLVMERGSDCSRERESSSLSEKDNSWM